MGTAIIPMMSMTTSKRALKLKVLQVWTRQHGAAGADIGIRVLFSFSTFFHVLGRHRVGPSRTVCSLCRCRTRLFVVSEFLGKTLECAFSVYAIPNFSHGVRVQLPSNHSSIAWRRSAHTRSQVEATPSC